jgi:hypothetical protein
MALAVPLPGYILLLTMNLVNPVLANALTPSV